MSETNHDSIRKNVREHYKEIALLDLQGLDPAGAACSADGCCGATPSSFDIVSSRLGYSNEELSTAPEGANLGLGCGNPQAIAALKPGEIVLDLGSGAGFDCFLASRRVGESGLVIGVDMTPEMVRRARGNAVKGNYVNTEFRLGEIEHLPVANATVDVIISNCVINLSPDKLQVFREAYRVLKPGGRLAISDVITTAELPAEIRNDLNELYSGCISGASSAAEITEMLAQSGFSDISIEPKDESVSFIKDWLPGANVENYIVSAIIQAVKA
ncbi:ubiquinone/menaquinone biosynthesis C-methylase UbiE [Fontibacillus phaseoli]|uniref:Arsenite methyltransferase n=1 Tax=Fontibacillus phaseoli TaxID=1416533 RepID=A0A369BR05_9BACL|nr:arsenite methyltransferase [Fontibacillus phaseoli]RCX23821.1 ubiquinone/menaquinone biosynthesis C-methylase UbiE [Fontibacillus phaseoli]